MKATTTFLLCLLALPLAPAGAGQELPLRIDARPEVGTHEPLWVAEEVAVKDGELDWSLFSESSRQSLGAALAQAALAADAPPACRFGLRSSWHGAVWNAPAQTVKELLEVNEVVVDGQIVATQQGFYSGFPATLAQVRSDEILRAPVDGFNSKLFLLVVPNARMVVGSKVLCAVDSHFPREFQIGSRVLVFLKTGGSRSERELIGPGSYTFARAMATGGVAGPAQLSEELSGLKFSDLLQLARGPRGGRDD